MSLSVNAKRRLQALELLAVEEPFLTYSLPVRATSRANDHRSNHWAPRAKAAKAHRQAAHLAGARHRVHLRRLLAVRGLVVRVVRIAPTELDAHENLGMSLKAVSDGVADLLGVNDRDERLHLVPDGERGPWAVRVEFYEGDR